MFRSGCGDAPTRAAPRTTAAARPAWRTAARAGARSEAPEPAPTLAMSVTAAAPASSCAATRRCHMPRTSARAPSPRSSSSAPWSGECTITSWRPASAGYLLGTTRTRQPGPSGSPPAGRSASTSGGVIASLPAQKGQGGAAASRPAASAGRVARARRDDGELAAGRVAAELAAVRRHRPLPLPLVSDSSRPRSLGRAHGHGRASERGAPVDDGAVGTVTYTPSLIASRMCLNAPSMPWSSATRTQYPGRLRRRLVYSESREASRLVLASSSRER